MKGTKMFVVLILVFTLLASMTSCGDNTASSGQQADTQQTTVKAATPEQATAEQTITEDYGDTGGLKLPIVDEPVTLTINVQTDYTNLSDSFVAKEVLKRTGIKLDIQEWPSTNTAFTEKLKITLASGKLPDILYLANRVDVNQLGMQGAFVPINKYSNDLPNFKQIFIDNKENSWVMKSYSADDNNLYWWPAYEWQRDVNHGFLYRKDIFDKNGIKEWETTEEFYQALKKLKELYPDSIPYSSKNKEAIFSDLAYGWGLRTPVYFDESAKLWKVAATQPEYMDMIDFIKKLYDEGLLDPEFLTDTQAGWTAKMTEKEKSFVTYDWIGRLEMFYAQVKDQIPEYDLRYANPIGPVANIRRLNKVDNSIGFAVANNPNKEAALKFLDYATSPSGSKLLTMGVEGITYTKDASGKITYPEITGKAVGIKDLEEKYGIFMMGVYTRVDKESVYFSYTDREKEAQDKMINNNKIEQSDPILKFTREEQDIITEVQTSLDKSAKEFSSKYVLDKSYGQKEWNEWLSTAEKLGAKKLEEAYNNAQKRYESD